MPPRQPTPSCRYAFSRPLLSAQHLCCWGRKFAADNRQCVYICSLDFCILRELMARQSGWPVGSCRIQSRYDSFVIKAFIALKAGWQPRRVVRIRNIAGRTWHTGPAAPASLVAAPRTVIMRLANPIGIPTASALVSTTYHADNEFARRRGPNPDRRRALELLSGCGAESCGDP
jgi:hypothetical protein